MPKHLRLHLGWDCAVIYHHIIHHSGSKQLKTIGIYLIMILLWGLGSGTQFFCWYLLGLLIVVQLGSDSQRKTYSYTESLGGIPSRASQLSSM